MKKEGKRAWKTIRTLVLLYLSGGIIFYLIQDLLIFHPKPLQQNHKFLFNTPFTELNISVQQNRNLNIVQFHADNLFKGIVLYFHGNMKNIERYAPYAPHFTNNGYEVWMIDYPGYGKSTGKRTEANMYRDALLLYSMAVQKTTTSNIIIYGKSLGTGVASFLASEKKCKKLILETPYYSMVSLGKHYCPIYPVANLIHYKFPINKYLQKINVPVTIFHGTEDETVPYRHTQKLKKENPAIEVVTVLKGTHNNLYEFPQVVQKLEAVLKQ